MNACDFLSRVSVIRLFFNKWKKLVSWVLQNSWLDYIVDHTHQAIVIFENLSASIIARGVFWQGQHRLQPDFCEEVAIFDDSAQGRI